MVSLQPANQGQPPHPALKRCGQVLDPLTRAVPGLLEALYLLAKVRYLCGDVEPAQSTLQHCLNQDATYSDAHILMAQVSLSSTYHIAPNKFPFHPDKCSLSILIFLSFIVKLKVSEVTK